MKFTQFFVIFLAASITVFASKAQHAHVHGEGELDISVQGLKALVDFEAPSESILGFEREPRNKKEEQAKADALAFLKDKPADFFVFDASLGCVIKTESVIVEVGDADDHHNDVKGQWSVTCQKPLTGSGLEIKLQEKFSKLKVLEIDIVSDSGEKSSKSKSKSLRVKL